MTSKVKKTGVNGKPGKPSTESQNPRGEWDRLEKLYQEAEIVKLNSMRLIAVEMNRPETEPRQDVQKESQIVMKAIEIQLRLWAELNRQNWSAGSVPALEEIWQALTGLPVAGAVLRRESVRARLVERLKKGLGRDGLEGAEEAP